MRKRWGRDALVSARREQILEAAIRGFANKGSPALWRSGLFLGGLERLPLALDEAVG